MRTTYSSAMLVVKTKVMGMQHIPLALMTFPPSSEAAGSSVFLSELFACVSGNGRAHSSKLIEMFSFTASKCKDVDQLPSIIIK